ncbi:unnamed protein product [Polarella glacialis]|uniref:Uncharacterized protein n=1 Tax=Polarella glacialis TaxID=89957 RepID=A0A813G7S2_POLGL|nr:unnamed protein product [Polarella glacialis]
MAKQLNKDCNSNKDHDGKHTHVASSTAVQAPQRQEQQRERRKPTARATSNTGIVGLGSMSATAYCWEELWKSIWYVTVPKIKEIHVSSWRFTNSGRKVTSRCSSC